MQSVTDKLIVALDVDTLPRARHFVDVLYPAVKLFKVGSQLYTACGPEVVQMVVSKGASVFLDLKFLDIPNTVFSAVASGTGLNAGMVSMKMPVGEESEIKRIIFPGIFMMTVHTIGGADMLKKAVEGAQSKATQLKINRPLIVGVTKLTSDKGEANTQDVVLERALLAKESGLDGVVCSAHEAKEVRKACGADFIIVTPGIRPNGADAADQKRVATAKDAFLAGANYIVVGRPILEADDPLEAAKNIIKEME